MEFKEFNTTLQQRVADMLENTRQLYVANVDKDALWELYLDSFQTGTNEIFRKRRIHDCSCCRQFIRSFGNVVAIKDNKPVSIWDLETGDDVFQPVVNALAAFVKSAQVQDCFVTKQGAFGTEQSHEQSESGAVYTWYHFRIELPRAFVTRSSRSEAALTGELRDSRKVFKRSLDEISQYAIETVLDLIAEKSLYKGDEWQAVLTQFLALRNEYHALPDGEKDNYCWSKSVQVGGAVARIRNHSIGTLLQDLTSGVDILEAVRKYEHIVAPQYYKRPKAIFTRAMVEQAEQTIADLSLLDSLRRRHARLDDITINNVIWSNKDAARHMNGAGGVFELLKSEVAVNPRRFERVEGIGIEHFIKRVLPTATSLEILLGNRHAASLVSLIAPAVAGSQSLFKWSNGFSWVYSGNVADSMKERVKAAGGNIEGVLRLSLQWNENSDNPNDFDAHCVEPDGNHIYYPNKRRIHPSSGVLDVDIINPGGKVAVENITWGVKSRMQEGVYELFVRNYSHNGGRSGFSAEIEHDGQIYEYEYSKELAQGERVQVAKLEFSKRDGIKFLESLPSSTSSRKLWSLQTNQFHPVSVCTFSPNYWDGQCRIGHKHTFFMLAGCINDELPNGFFNEYLSESLMPHKRVFAALGNKMKVAQSDNQLSGIGFSSTKRNSLVVKIDGKRVVKIIF